VSIDEEGGLYGDFALERLQAMQKMQSAAGGKGRGAGGMPTPAQIQAMQVSRCHQMEVHPVDRKLARNAAWHVAADATANEGQRNARNDEGHDAGTGRRPIRHGRDATYVSGNTKRFLS
jgi:hypothetical protein